MKNLDIANGRLKKVVALLLVTCMVVGLLSSAAVKVVASTYYMQTKRKLKVNNPIVQQAIDTIVGDNNIAGPETTAPTVTAPATTEAPTTQAPTTETPTTESDTSEVASDETTATTTAVSGSSGSSTDILGTITGLLGGLGSFDIGGMLDGVGDMLGGLGGGSSEETTTTTESTTESKASKAQKKEVLSEYNAVVNYAKKIGKPAFTKVTYRTLEKDGAAKLLFRNVESQYPEYFISKENAEAAPILVPANTETSELLIDNEYFAGMLATADASDAIESATSVKLEDGSQKITITLRDEVDPAITVADSKTAASFTSAMFPVIDAETVKEKVASTLKITKITGANVTYTECTVELIFNPSLNRIISVKQTVKHVDNVEGYIIEGMLPVSGSATVTEISEYRDFDYGLL